MIKLTDVSFNYRGVEAPVVTRANFEVASGEFVLVCGPTGSGKSTLLRIINGLSPHFTGGNLRGRIELNSLDRTGAKPHELADLVGFVNQQPEGAFVADTVEDELAYAMEQLGRDPSEMAREISRLADALGIADLLTSPLTSLSGGQQQRVAIAAALSAGQRILILDEPTSALDPEAAHEIIASLAKLTKDLGITVLLSEHRLERALPLVDSVIVVYGDGSVSKLAPTDALRENRLVPPVVELSAKLGLSESALEPDELRSKIKAQPNLLKNISTDAAALPTQPAEFAGLNALEVRGLSVAYGENLAVDSVDLSVERGEVLTLMGENGSGKSSLLWAIQGSGERAKGEVLSNWGETAKLSPEERLCVVTMVPQRASDLLFLSSVSAELEDSDRFAQAKPTSTATLFARFAGRVDPAVHPRDLSAGQQLALVLAIQLVKGAGVVLLDEPTRGLDYEAKRALARIIGELRTQGHALVLASHDIEFVAQVATKVVVLEKGRIKAQGAPVEILGVDGLLPSQVSVALGQPGIISLEQIRGTR